jgi:hypothetical protein
VLATGRCTSGFLKKRTDPAFASIMIAELAIVTGAPDG